MSRSGPSLLCAHAVASAFVASCLSANPVSAAEFMHCYLREAPDDAPISSEFNVSGLVDALPIAALKHACGAETGPDKALLESIVSAGKCSPESEISGYVAETFEFSPEELAADMISQSSPEVFADVCEAVSICTPGDAGYDEACNAAIDSAMGG